MATLCLTFDNMGNAKAIHDGLAQGPDRGEPGLAVGYPRLLALLDELGLHGTFFLEGWNAVHHPDRVLDLAQRGHEVAMHGWMHERFADLDAAAAADCIHRAHAAFRGIGLAPTGFRAPGGLRGLHAEPVLAQLGYRYDSSMGSAAEAAPDRIAALPGRLPSGLAHVPWHEALVDSIQYLRSARPPSPAELEASWMAAIDAVARDGGTTTLVVHAYVSGVDDERFAAVRNVLRHARRRGDIDFCTAAELAERVPPPATSGVS